jgi:Flp pilus assembly pilin Flp
MKKKFKKDFHTGQTSVEYFILLGMVVVVVLTGVKTFIPKARNEAEQVFNETVCGVMGQTPRTRVLSTYP